MNFKNCSKALKDVGLSFWLGYEPQEITLEDFGSAIDAFGFDYLIETTISKKDVECIVRILDGGDVVAFGEFRDKQRDSAENNAMSNSIYNLHCYINEFWPL